MTDKKNVQPIKPESATNAASPEACSDTSSTKAATSSSGTSASAVATSTPPSSMISLTVAPFTGGPFSVSVKHSDSVDELKKVVAKKLKVLKDRICLLYRERQLSDGTLEENSLIDGSKITLLPRAETGLLAQKPEQSVMQALESLSEHQVVDFLSGKAPLNLTMRLGDHMMLIQLQLSTVNSAAAKRARTAAAAAAAAAASSSSSVTGGTSSPPTSASASATSNCYKPRLDTRALAEASKNLTQTLKQLSSEVLSSKTAEEADRSRKRPRSSSSSSGGGSGGGAIIESMHHHGKGVYSGTFSGTLNPALQDRNGQPKRDITTIIHILNDLLCAQYKNYHHHHHHNHNHHQSTANATNAGVREYPGSSGSGIPCGSQSDSPVVLDQQQVTRGKLEQLRRIMEERKARRRARREARAAPYSTSWSLQSGVESTATSSASPASPDDSMDTSNDSTSESPSSSSSSSSSSAVASSKSGESGAGGEASEMFNSKPEPVTA